LHSDGIERRALKQKQFGVFDCRLAADHPMTEHFPEPLWVPHSRYKDPPEQALVDCGDKILTRSNAAGVDAFAKQDDSFFLFFQGHPEYEANVPGERRRSAFTKSGAPISAPGRRSSGPPPYHCRECGSAGPGAIGRSSRASRPAVRCPKRR
jgi:Homoserine O-succinyltransferase